MNHVRWADCENGERLINPHIEIGKGYEDNSSEMALVNENTFKRCLPRLIPPSELPEMDSFDFPFYTIYRVMSPVSRCLDCGECSPQPHLEPVSRKLIGYLEENALRENLPATHQTLELIKSADDLDEEGNNLPDGFLGDLTD